MTIVPWSHTVFLLSWGQAPHLSRSALDRSARHDADLVVDTHQMSDEWGQVSSHAARGGTQWRQGGGDGMDSEHVLLGDRPHIPQDGPYREPRVCAMTPQAGGSLPHSLAPLVQKSIWHRPGDLRRINEGHDPAWGHCAGPSSVQGSESQGGSGNMVPGPVLMSLSGELLQL